MKALDRSEAFQALAPNFVLAHIGARKELLTSTNNAYLLFLDAEGRELARLIKPGDSSLDGARQPASEAAVLDAMRTALAPQVVGVSGMDLHHKLLRDGRPAVRRDAVRLAERMEGDALIPALIERLRDRDGTTAGHAAHALGTKGPGASRAWKGLVRLAGDLRALPYARGQALHALAHIDPSPGDPSPWTEALRDDNPYVVLAAAEAAGAMSLPPAQLVGALMAAWTRHTGALLRMGVAKALGSFGADASAAAHLLGDNEDPRVAPAAKKALQAIQDASQ